MNSWTYSKAGVDLDEHRSMHEIALSYAKRLAEELGLRIEGWGGYSAWMKLWGRKLVLHVDGVGTKALVAHSLGKQEVIGWDCVAMNVNDIACAGAKPIALVDYIVMPEAWKEAFTNIMRGLYTAARKARVPIVGGETAIMPDAVNSIDAACSVLGEKIANAGIAEENDIVVGLESNGLHANGYTLVRRVLEKTIGYRGEFEGVEVEKELLKPTEIYVDFLLEAFENNVLTAAAHVTGGAFTKLKRILKPETGLKLKTPPPPPIFNVLMKLGGIPVEEMYRVFNMGIGLIVTASSENLDEILRLAEKHGHQAHVLGRVTREVRGIKILTPWGVEIGF